MARKSNRGRRRGRFNPAAVGGRGQGAATTTNTANTTVGATTTAGV